jgi:hypothetical protein
MAKKDDDFKIILKKNYLVFARNWSRKNKF